MDVELDAAHGARIGQRGGQGVEIQAEAGDVNQVAVGVDAEPGAVGVLELVAGAAPLAVRVEGEVGNRAASVDDQVEVLPGRDQMRSHGHVAAPLADIEVAVVVDGRGGLPAARGCPVCPASRSPR